MTRRRAQGDGFLPVEPLSEERFRSVEDRVLGRLAGEDLSHPDPELSRIPPTAEEEADEGRGRWQLPEGLRAFPGGRRRAVAFAGAGTLLGMAAAAAVWLSIPQASVPDAPEAAATLPTQRFATGAAPAEAQLGDVDVGLGAGTTMMAVGDDPRGWLVVLEQGRTRFVVPPRRRRPPFVVQAGSVRVEVVGTSFVVERDGRDVDVSVAEGRVRVTGPDGASILEPGDRFTTRRDPSDAAPTSPPSDPEEPSRTSADGADREPGPPHPSSSPMARFEAASRLEATAPGAALAAYRRLAREPGAWGANALYAAGRLATEMGRPVAARRLLRRYLARHPDGPNAPDARALLRAMPPEAQH